MTFGSRRGALLLTSALVGFSLFGLAVPAAAADLTYQFDIPAEPLGKALSDFSQASAQQIIFSNEAVAGHTSAGLHGRYTSAQALDELLAGTDLKVEINSAGVLMVRSKKAQAASDEGAAQGNVADVETVVVTGTHLRGQTATSPELTITAQSILDSGYATTGDVLRSLPLNFSGGMNPGVIGAGGVMNQDVYGASSANLRGIGPDATLTLIDGSRLAYSGFLGGTDVSVIPTAMIQRVEIVPDGASAIYGSDAVAGVVNFIMRRDFDGAQTSFRYGGATDGGADQTQINQLFGDQWDNGGVVVDYEYTRQDQLLAGQRSISASAPADLSLIPFQQSHSAFVTAHQSISPDIEFDVDAQYFARAYQTSVDFGGGEVEITPASASQFSVSPKLTIDLPDTWVADLAGVFSESHEKGSSTVLFNGTPIETNVLNGYDNNTSSVEASASGPLFQLAQNDVEAAIGGGYRWESYRTENSSPEKASRSVSYVYAELNAPFVHPSAERVGLNELSLDLAGRYENYSDVGASAVPKVGLRYVPVPDVVLHGTWGKSFKAPTEAQETSEDTAFLYNASTFGVSAPPGSQVLLRYGADALKPETAETTSFGADFQPHFIPNLLLSMDYFSIDYTNRIVQPITDISSAFSDPAFAQFVTFNPTAAQVGQAIAGSSQFYNYTFPPVPYNPATVAALADNRFVNVSSQTISGIDLHMTYEIDTEIGRILPVVDGTWIDLKQKATPSSPSEVLSGTVFNVPSFKGRASIVFDQGMWREVLTGNYISGGSYVVGATSGRTGAWTTVDAVLTARFGGITGASSGIETSLSVENLFDTAPPRIPASLTEYAGIGFDSANTSAIGRVVSLTLRYQW